MKMNEYQKSIPSFLYQFCSHYQGRLGRPFSRNGYTYATNGYILIRIEGELCKKGGPDLSSIPIYKLNQLNTWFNGIELTKSMLWKYRNRYICRQCVGTGITEDGKGCWVCAGLKWNINKAWVLDKYNIIGIEPLMRILENLGPTIFFPKGLHEEPIPFKSKQANGFLMPMRGLPEDELDSEFLINY